MNGTIPKNYTEPITVKFANNPSNNKAFPPLAAYLTPQTAAAARRFAGPIHHPTSGRFRLVSNSSSALLCNLPCKDLRFVCFLTNILYIIILWFAESSQLMSGAFHLIGNDF